MNSIQRIPATPTERGKLAQRIADALAAKREYERAEQVMRDLFTVFAEAHGVAGAMLVGIQGDYVVVRAEDAAKAIKPPPSEPAA